MFQAAAAAEPELVDVFAAAKVEFEKKFAAAGNKTTVNHFVSPRSLPIDDSHFQKPGKHHGLEWDYEGQLNADGLFHGIGRMTFNNGGWYEGSARGAFLRIHPLALTPALAKANFKMSSGGGVEPSTCMTVRFTQVNRDGGNPANCHGDSCVSGGFVKNNFHGYGTHK